MMNGSENEFYETNGWKIYYEKFGSGPNVVLLIPGAIGTGKSDFQEMLDGEDELDWDKFTVIAVEAPGWGRSRPPLRSYNANVYNNDSECFHAVMQHLSYDKYSIIGWSEGAKVALLMAIKYRNFVESLVLTAISTDTTVKTISSVLSTKSVDSWNKSRVEAYLKVYQTKDEIQKLWTRFVKFREHYLQYFPEDIFKDKYHLVKCPVLITHGDQDRLIEREQPLSVSEKLKNARLHHFPNGEHDCHIKYSTQFTKLVQDHILNKNNNHQESVLFEAGKNEMDQFMNNRILA